MSLSDPYVALVELEDGKWDWRLISRSGGLPEDLKAESGRSLADVDSARRSAVRQHPELSVVEVPRPA